MSDKKPVMFAVKINIEKMLDAQIMRCQIAGSNKNEWRVYTLGKDGGRKVTLKKSTFVLFGSMLGANAHIVSAIEKKIDQLEQVIDDWYDIAERHRIPLRAINSEDFEC